MRTSLDFWMSTHPPLPFETSKICESGCTGVGVLVDLNGDLELLWGRVFWVERGSPPHRAPAVLVPLCCYIEILPRDVRRLGMEGAVGYLPRAVYTAPTLVTRPWHQEELLALTGCVLTPLTIPGSQV